MLSLETKNAKTKNESRMLGFGKFLHMLLCCLRNYIHLLVPTGAVFVSNRFVHVMINTLKDQSENRKKNNSDYY